MRRKRLKEGSTRQSIWFYSDMVKDDPHLNKKSDYHYTAETHMLIEDVELSCLPIPGYSTKNYRVTLTASQPNIEKLIIEAIETEYDYQDLAQSIYEFFHTCVRVIMVYGHAGYEIAYSSRDGGDFDSFEFVLIPPSAFKVRKNRFRQYVPLELANQLKLETQFINFPPDNILLFTLPDYVQPYHKTMMDALAYLGRNLYPRWALQNLYERKIPFSQSDYALSREIALAKATRIVGWNARNYNSDYKFEHYVWRRQLLFYKFLCSLRASILEKFNEGLHRVGKKMNFTAELSIEGLPTIADAELALEKLQQGDLTTFEEVLKPFG